MNYDVSRRRSLLKRDLPLENGWMGLKRLKQFQEEQVMVLVIANSRYTLEMMS